LGGISRTARGSADIVCALRTAPQTAPDILSQ